MSIETDQILTFRKIFNVARRNLYDHTTNTQYTWSILCKCNSKELPVIERGIFGIAGVLFLCHARCMGDTLCCNRENSCLLFTNRVRICYTMGIENADRWVEDRQK